MAMTCSLAANARPAAVMGRSRAVGMQFSATSGTMQRSSRRQARQMSVRASTAESSLDVTKMSPLGDRMLVRPKPEDDTSSGGIILSSSGGGRPSMQEAIVGAVVSVGDDVDVGVAVGDMILYSKYGTSDVEGPDGTLSFVAQKSVLAKLS